MHCGAEAADSHTAKTQRHQLSPSSSLTRSHRGLNAGLSVSEWLWVEPVHQVVTIVPPANTELLCLRRLVFLRSPGSMLQLNQLKTNTSRVVAVSPCLCFGPGSTDRVSSDSVGPGLQRLSFSKLAPDLSASVRRLLATRLQSPRRRSRCTKLCCLWSTHTSAGTLYSEVY